MSNLISSILANKNLVFAQSDVCVHEIANLMSTYHIGAVVIKDEDNVLGLISERDITRKVVAKRLDFNTTLAHTILHANVTILDSTDTIEKAMQVITETRRRHVLITENGEITSIVSIGDLMKHLLDEKSNTIEQLQQYIYS